MTGRVDILWHIFEKITIFECYYSNLPKIKFFFLCDFILIFWQFSQQCARVYGPFRSYFYEILRSSNFFGQTSPRCCSRASPGGWIKNIFFNKTFRYVITRAGEPEPGYFGSLEPKPLEKKN